MEDSKKNGMELRLSRLTIAWGIYLVVSAAFMLQVNTWLADALGIPFLRGCFWVASLIVMSAAAVYAFRARIGAFRLGAVVLIFVLAFVVGMLQRYFDERTHILMYGLLGYLAAKDLVGNCGRVHPARVLMAVAFVATIGACDETFQLLLPYRFGEIGDFITNAVCGALGVALFLALRKRADPVR